METLSGRGQSFTAKVEENGVRILYEEGGELMIKWCFWWGAVKLLCHKAPLGSCVEIGAIRGEAFKQTIEGAAQGACKSGLSTATWIATILEKQGLVYICQRRPLGIKLTEEGMREFCMLGPDKEEFENNISSVLKDIGKFR